MRIGDLLRTDLIVSVFVLLQHQLKNNFSKGGREQFLRGGQRTVQRGGCELVPGISGMIRDTLPMDVVYHTRHFVIPLSLNNISETLSHSSVIK